MPHSKPANQELALPVTPRRPGRLRQGLLLALAMACGMLVAGNPFRPSSENPDATARGYLRFKEILSYVDRDYVDSVDTEGLADYAVMEMLEKLDPHSVYIPARDRDRKPTPSCKATSTAWASSSTCSATP